MKSSFHRLKKQRVVLKRTHVLCPHIRFRSPGLCGALRRVLRMQRKMSVISDLAGREEEEGENERNEEKGGKEKSHCTFI